LFVVDILLDEPPAQCYCVLSSLIMYQAGTTDREGGLDPGALDAGREGEAGAGGRPTAGFRTMPQNPFRNPQ
jgi:hypothetical protein